MLFRLRWEGGSYFSEVFSALRFISSFLRSPSEVLTGRLLGSIFLRKEGQILVCNHKIWRLWGFQAPGWVVPAEFLASPGRRGTRATAAPSPGHQELLRT